MKILFFVIIITISSATFATDQQPDYLFYKNKKAELFTSYEWNSPLAGVLELPMTSTANFRGYVATYIIDNYELLLSEIVISEYDKSTNKRTNKIKHLSDYFPGKIKNNKVKVDWFNGLLQILIDPYKVWQKSPYGTDMYYIDYKSYAIFEIKNGNVVNILELPTKEYYLIYDKLENNLTSKVDNKYNLIVKWFNLINETRKRNELLYKQYLKK